MRKTTLSLLLAVLSLPLGAARAQQAPAVENQPAAPVAYPYDTAMPVEPAQMQAPPPQMMPPPAPMPMYPQMPPQAMPMQPGYAPPPPPAYYPPPSAPIYLPPGYWVPAPGFYPPQMRPPVFRRPPPVVRRVVRREVTCRGGSCRLNRPDRARFFSVGGRASVLAINQEIGDKSVNLLGGGFELRIRTRGHFGLELGVDFLKGNFELNGPIQRESVPSSLSALLYVFPNRDDRRFNLYFLGGMGFIPTTMSLVDPMGQQVKQNFNEWEAHLGLGAELRFRWFALRADVRGLSMWRDEKNGDAPLYQGVEGAPVPARSFGVQGTLGAAIWL